MALSISSLSPRNQIAVYGVLMVGLAYAVFTYYHSPLGKEVEQLEQQVGEMRREVQEGMAVEAQVPLLEAELIQQRARLASLRQVLPDEKETAQIIREVHDTAVAANLEIKSFIPQPTIGHVFYDDWPILMSVEGSYESLGEFLEKVSEFERLVNVYDIAIRQLENPGPERTLTASYTATTYVYREPEPQAERVNPNEIAAVIQ